MKHLLDTIERVLPEGGDWCSVEKGTRLAAMVLGAKPQTVLEIGVWRGGSAIPLALALAYNRTHDPSSTCATNRLIAIDPWDHQASIAGEEPANVEWWGKDIGPAGHEDAYRCFLRRVTQLELGDIVETWRKKSDDCTPPNLIDLLHVDGNHTDQAVRDVDRFARRVAPGGIMILDDLNWSSGGVGRARALAHQLGFVDRYPLGSGIVMQRISSPSS